MGEQDDAGKDRRATPDYISKLIRLLEAKARAAGVTREEYLDGMIKGKYPHIDTAEVDGWRADEVA